eukprot:m.783440 g.783440  ORF g.783440 m.783440 type:complete len:304 (+) comp23294_c0_seq16:200-1111(+)
MLGTHGAVRARDIHPMCPGQYMPRGTIKRVVFHNDICRQYRCAARCKLDTSTSSARCQRRLCHSANAVATNNLPPKVWSGVAHTATVRGAMLEQINAIGSHEGVPGVLAEDGRHAIRRCAQPKDLHGTTTTTRTAIPRRACVHVDEIVVSQHTPERETKRLHHHPPCKRIASDNLASDAARHGHHRGNSNVGVKRRLQVQDSLGRIVRVDAEPNHQPSLPHPRAAHTSNRQQKQPMSAYFWPRYCQQKQSVSTGFHERKRVANAHTLAETRGLFKKTLCVTVARCCNGVSVTDVYRMRYRACL